MRTFRLQQRDRLDGPRERTQARQGRRRGAEEGQALRPAARRADEHQGELPNSVAAADISVIGPLARSAADLDVALDIMAGPDPDDGGYMKVALPKCQKTSLRQFRVAVKLKDAESDVDGEYADQLQGLVDRLAKAGAKVKEAAPDIDTARLNDVYIRMLRAATSARMPDSDIEDWKQAFAAGEKEKFLEQSVDGVTMTHRRWLQLNNERHQIRLKFNAFFRDYDILLCPVAA